MVSVSAAIRKLMSSSKKGWSGWAGIFLYGTTPWKAEALVIGSNKTISIIFMQWNGWAALPDSDFSMAQLRSQPKNTNNMTGTGKERPF